MTRTAVLSNISLSGQTSLSLSLPQLSLLISEKKKIRVCTLLLPRKTTPLWVVRCISAATRFLFRFPIGYHKPLKRFVFRLVVSLFDPENKIFLSFFLTQTPFFVDVVGGSGVFVICITLL